VGRCGWGARCSLRPSSVVCGLAAGSLWIGSRMLQEPKSSGRRDSRRRRSGSAEDLRHPPRCRTATGRTRQIVLSEPELNAFLSRHLVAEAGPRSPLGLGPAVSRRRDNRVQRTSSAPARPRNRQPSSRPWPSSPSGFPMARVSLEVGAARGQRRYLRFDIERLALGRSRCRVCSRSFC